MGGPIMEKWYRIWNLSKFHLLDKSKKKYIIKGKFFR